MNLCVGSLSPKINGGEICLTDSATIHSIFWDQKYFSHITLVEANVNLISGPANLIDGSRIATVMLPCGTIFHINDVLYSIRSRRNIMDIILRSHMTIVKNIYALLILFQARSL